MKIKTIGVIGGSGRVGREVVHYLLRNTAHHILLGSRKSPEDNVPVLSSRHIKTLTVDVFKENLLSAFCESSDILINCAGPSAIIGDRIAKAALEHDVHYVDPGGHNPLYHGLTSHDKILREKSLTFVLAVGILPGLSELFPIYEADRHFDRVHSMEYYYIGRDRWTRNSAYDIAWGVGNIGKGEAPVIYEQGKLKEVNLLTSGKSVSLPDPVGTQKLFPVFREEFREFVEDRGIGNVRVYGNNWGVWVSLATIVVRLLSWYGTERKLWRSADLIVRASKRDMKGKKPGFMLHLVMHGIREKKPVSRTSTLFFEDTYRATGICAAIAARMIADNHIPPGRLWASQLPDVTAFMDFFQKEHYLITHDGIGESMIQSEVAAT